jgi:hypothetical protein
MDQVHKIFGHAGAPGLQIAENEILNKKKRASAMGDRCTPSSTRSGV